jgi:hypothetical protein
MMEYEDFTIRNGVAGSIPFPKKGGEVFLAVGRLVGLILESLGWILNDIE